MSYVTGFSRNLLVSYYSQNICFFVSDFSLMGRQRALMRSSKNFNFPLAGVAV
jgi:hypothetical protein